MELNITARHLELTPAISEYVHRKVEKSQRYFNSIISAQTTLIVEKYRHIAEIIVHTPGNTFKTKAEAGDLYSAIDSASHKLDLHLSRVKDKQKNHRLLKKKRFIKKNDIEDNVVVTELPVKDLDVTKIFLEPMSVTQAAKELEASTLPLFIFINENSMQVNALYKKSNQEFTLVETENDGIAEQVFKSKNYNSNKRTRSI